MCCYIENDCYIQNGWINLDKSNSTYQPNDPYLSTTFSLSRGYIMYFYLHSLG